jgi:hypothetical protein
MAAMAAIPFSPPEPAVASYCGCVSGKQLPDRTARVGQFTRCARTVHGPTRVDENQKVASKVSMST